MPVAKPIRPHLVRVSFIYSVLRPPYGPREYAPRYFVSNNLDPPEVRLGFINCIITYYYILIFQTNPRIMISKISSLLLIHYLFRGVGNKESGVMFSLYHMYYNGVLRTLLSIY